jgi:hypothetical protein
VTLSATTEATASRPSDSEDSPLVPAFSGGEAGTRWRHGLPSAAMRGAGVRCRLGLHAWVYASGAVGDAEQEFEVVLARCRRGCKGRGTWHVVHVEQAWLRQAIRQQRTDARPEVDLTPTPAQRRPA